MQFNIGSHLWPGLSKLVEEAGEVIQVLGKLIGSGGKEEHWDGSNLRARLQEEIGDLLAAIDFFIDKNSLAREVIADRRRVKLALFEDWHRAEQAKEECAVDPGHEQRGLPRVSDLRRPCP